LPIFEPARSSPLAESCRSAWAACKPFPRSTKLKHFDCDTKTLISAAGDSRFRAVHHWFCGSVTASVPIFLSQIGIWGGGASARAALADSVEPAEKIRSEQQNTISRGDFFIVFGFPSGKRRVWPGLLKHRSC
jgi:hypothetical protein